MNLQVLWKNLIMWFLLLMFCIFVHLCCFSPFLTINQSNLQPSNNLFLLNCLCLSMYTVTLMWNILCFKPPNKKDTHTVSHIISRHGKVNFGPCQCSCFERVNLSLLLPSLNQYTVVDCLISFSSGVFGTSFSFSHWTLSYPILTNNICIHSFNS